MRVLGFLAAILLQNCHSVPVSHTTGESNMKGIEFDPNFCWDLPRQMLCTDPVIKHDCPSRFGRECPRFTQQQQLKQESVMKGIQFDESYCWSVPRELLCTDPLLKNSCRSRSSVECRGFAGDETSMKGFELDEHYCGRVPKKFICSDSFYRNACPSRFGRECSLFTHQSGETNMKGMELFDAPYCNDPPRHILCNDPFLKQECRMRVSRECYGHVQQGANIMKGIEFDANFCWNVPRQMLCTDPLMKRDCPSRAGIECHGFSQHTQGESSMKGVELDEAHCWNVPRHVLCTDPFYKHICSSRVSVECRGFTQQTMKEGETSMKGFELDEHYCGSVPRHILCNDPFYKQTCPLRAGRECPRFTHQSAVQGIQTAQSCDPKTQMFSQCGGYDMCQSTCAQKYPICPLICFPGCVCKPGFTRLRRDGPCIEQSKCPKRANNMKGMELFDAPFCNDPPRHILCNDPFLKQECRMRVSRECYGLTASTQQQGTAMHMSVAAIGIGLIGFGGLFYYFNKKEENCDDHKYEEVQNLL